MDESEMTSVKGTIDNEPADEKIQNISLSQFSVSVAKSKPQTSSVNRTNEDALDILQSDIE